MRTNLPVSVREYAMPSDQTLVSVTDLKGRITYCNPAFIEVSGFSSEELLGQPHNIVRHPDMPEEAFRDMWATIQARQPWTGLVKNRRKNGDFYWVQANATPMLDGDQITGFLSVRTSPRRQDVQAAEALYATMNRQAKNNALSLKLSRGEVQDNSLQGRAARMLKLGALGKVAAVQIASVAAICAALVLDAPDWAVVTIAIAGAGVSLFASWVTTLAPLQALVGDANSLAAGDLSHQVTTGNAGLIGQLQRALMQMSVNLKTVVGDVRSELDQLTTSVKEIAEGNQDLSSRTESQASSLQQTAASMEQINATVQQSANSAGVGSRLSQETIQITQRSNEAVNSVSASMQGIATASQKINEIIQMIDGVAFQTNILALNAAIEAARAGEHGRGFSVVAAEVRALSHRTSEAAKDIKQLISNSSETIRAGGVQTEEALERMGAALDSVSKVSEVLKEISSASGEQTVGISQINEAITQMDSLTQQNAAMVEELAATAKSLHSQAANVSSSMRLFRLRRGEQTVAQLDAVGIRRESKGQLRLETT